MSTPLETYTISSPKGVIGLDISELYRYRELLYTFIWRDIKVRYKQTVLGIAWAVLQPLTTMLIFSIFFGGLAKIPSDGIPYPIFVFAGLLFWNYFSTAVTSCSNSLIDNENVVKKIYFPRLLLPLSAISTPLLDFMISWIILHFIMMYYKFGITIEAEAVVLLSILVCWFTAFGLGTFFAAINSKYRDIRYVLPFFIQLLLFITPIIYPVNLLPESAKWILYLNPLTAVVDSVRDVIFNTSNLNLQYILISFFSMVLLLIGGVVYFKKTESYFADIL